MKQVTSAQKAVTAPDHRRRRAVRRHGGTLLEVLISLVIVAMALRLVVQVADRARAADRLSRDAQLGIDSAILWRSARLDVEPWAEGERGQFPDVPVNWRLVAVQHQGEDPHSVLDDRWRMLELQRAEDERPFWSTLVRLDVEEEVADMQQADAKPGDR